MAAVDELEKRIKEIYTAAYNDLYKNVSEYKAKIQKKWDEVEKQYNNGTITLAEKQAKQAQLLSGTTWIKTRDHVADILTKTNELATAIVNESAEDFFAYSVNHANYDMENGAGVSFGFGIYDRNTIYSLIKDEPELLPKKKLDPNKDVPWNMKKIDQAVAQSIVMGESIPQLAKRIADVTSSANRVSMLRAARTAMTGAQNGGRVASMREAEKMGLRVQKKWMATLDSRTRDTHRHLDGQSVPLDEKFTVNGKEIDFPGDPTAPPELVYNCRCVLVHDLIDFPSTYNRYDQMDGKQISGMSYDEWEQAKATGKDTAPKSPTWSISPDLQKPWLPHDLFKFTPTKLIGGKGDAEVTDSIYDYYLPKNTREKLAEIEALQTYNDFKNYTSSNYGIELDTGLEKLKTEMANESIEAVQEQCRKIITAIDAYKEVFGEDALSSLHKIVLCDKDLDVQAAYFFNRIGENDPLAGEIHFRGWGDSGRAIFHELAHAFQDSHKTDGEDAVGFSERIVKALKATDLKAYFGASSEDYAAEQFADAFGFGFSQGLPQDVKFIEGVAEILARLKWSKNNEDLHSEIKIAQGKDISESWTRRQDQFAFEIEDVMNAQGFDGKPRVVSAEEFDELVKQANGGKGFIAQRTYTAPNQEVLDSYREMLYDGKWYVDCSTGGAQYGQGMYCAADYNGNLTDGIKAEMEHYGELGKRRLEDEANKDLPQGRAYWDIVAAKKEEIGNMMGNKVLANGGSNKEAFEAWQKIDKMDTDEFIKQYLPELQRKSAVSYTETLTLDPSAKIIKYSDLETEFREYRRGYAYDVLQKKAQETVFSSMDLTKSERKDYEQWYYLYANASTKKQQAEYNALTEKLGLTQERKKDIVDKIKSNYNDLSRNSITDIGSYAAAKGYDAINAEGHGESGSYTVVLNRTKVIFRRDE